MAATVTKKKKKGPTRADGPSCGLCLDGQRVPDVIRFIERDEGDGCGKILSVACHECEKELSWHSVMSLVSGDGFRCAELAKRANERRT